jgi:hypothetical protein
MCLLCVLLFLADNNCAEVIVSGQLPSGAIAAEKVLRYFEESLKAKVRSTHAFLFCTDRSRSNWRQVNLAAQLRLKNDVLIGQIRRTRQTLKEKDEVMGDVRNCVGMHVMRIVLLIATTDRIGSDRLRSTSNRKQTVLRKDPGKERRAAEAQDGGWQSHPGLWTRFS